MKGRTYHTFSSLLLIPSEPLENTVKTVNMSTSSDAASSLMLSLSEFARLMSERHYLFLSHSLNDLDRQVERHRSELHYMECALTHLRHQTLQQPHYNYVESSSTSFSEPTPSSLSNVEPQHRRRSLKDHPPSPSYRTTNMGSRENPIYVYDDNEIECAGCLEKGHFVGDCKEDYRFDGRQYWPILEGENYTGPTYVVDKDYYRHFQDFKQNAESPRHSKTSA
jgi:hypothetical protein